MSALAQSKSSASANGNPRSSSLRKLQAFGRIVDHAHFCCTHNNYPSPDFYAAFAQQVANQSSFVEWAAPAHRAAANEAPVQLAPQIDPRVGLAVNSALAWSPP